MSETQQLFVPLKKLVGSFTFVAAPKFAEKQEEFAAILESELVKQTQSGKIDRPHIEIKARAKEPEWILVIDVRNEQLLFNVSAQDIVFRLGESSDFALAATYMESFVRASEVVLGDRHFVGFDVRSTQIVRFEKPHNSALMARLLQGLTNGEALFEHVPGAQPDVRYRVQRTDAKWAVLVDDLEYIFDVQAPSNDDWRTLWFDFMVRSPEEKVASKEHLNDIEGAIAMVNRGQPFLRALCEGAKLR